MSTTEIQVLHHSRPERVQGTTFETHLRERVCLLDVVHFLQIAEDRELQIIARCITPKLIAKLIIGGLSHG